MVQNPVIPAGVFEHIAYALVAMAAGARAQALRPYDADVYEPDLLAD
jgi:hypothetical protein